jgi:outer membrane protein OmpA-like peptidoglycan-associated protein
MMRTFLLLIASASILFSNEIRISFDTPYIFNKRLQQKKTVIPKNPLIPVVEGFEINRAQYKNYDKLQLSYMLPDKTRMSEKREGKYWYIDYKKVEPLKVKGKEREAARQQLLEAYRQALLERGVTVYTKKNSKTSFVMNLGNQWGLFQAYPDSMNIKVVEIEAFEQKLHIDPDEIQAELIKSGEIELEGVYFDTAKATLKPASRPSILAAAALLKKYPTLVLEVQGHTDSVGSDEANLDLSDRRAASVKQALIAEGIEAKRLESKGYGEAIPVASNESDEGRAKNRRVMLKRLSGGEEKAVVTVDFFKPIPGFEKEKVREYDEAELFFRINQDGQKENKKIFGKEVRAYYEVIDKKERSYSYLEILKNYEGVLESFGAVIEGKDFPGTQAIYFHMPDRGDGQEVYGKVGATDGGTYTIHFFIPQ